MEVFLSDRSLDRISGGGRPTMHALEMARQTTGVFFMRLCFWLGALIFAIVCCLLSRVVNSLHVCGPYYVICNNKAIACPLGTQ